MRRTALDLPILLFFGWVLITTGVAVDPAYSLAEWRKSAARALMFFFVASAIREQRHVKGIVLALVAGAILQAGAAVFASASEGVDVLRVEHREDGWTSSSQWLSSYLVMALPFCYLAWTLERRPAWRRAYAAGMALLLVALFLTHTRAAWLACIVQALVLLSLRLMRSARLAGALATLTVAAVLFAAASPGKIRDLLVQHHFTSTSSMLLRFATWAIAAEQIAAHPVTGLGYGKHSFRHVLPEGHEALHAHIHNTFLAIAVEVGIPGLLLFLWIFLRILRAGLESWRRTPGELAGQLGLAVLLATVGVMVRNLFDDMFVGTLVYLFWLVAGVHFALRPSGDRAVPPPAAAEAPARLLGSQPRAGQFGS